MTEIVAELSAIESDLNDIKNLAMQAEEFVALAFKDHDYDAFRLGFEKITATIEDCCEEISRQIIL